MKKKTNFNGAVGAWMTSELHPSGASFDSPNSNFSSVKFNQIYASVDYMSIGWFGVNTDDHNSPTLQTSNHYLASQVADARSQNPNIILFGLLSYSEEQTEKLSAIINNPTVLATFCSNIATYLSANGLNGFDIDWENPTWNLSQTECALWLNALGEAFGDNVYLALSPSATINLDPDAVNNNVDLINLQSFWVGDPGEFISYGINPSLLGYGAYFESQVTARQAADSYRAGISHNGQTYPYNSMISWRLDSSDWTFEQSQQLLLRPYMTGEPYLMPFDDGAIFHQQTTATKISNIVIRSGEVVDAIQVTNSNADGSYMVQLLQHGGDGGTQNDPITINPSQGLTHFSYVTGMWYGQQVVAQIMINGTSYPATISSSVSSTASHEVSAPEGQTIVAFRGQTKHVLLAGGGFTWVLSAIDAEFA
ncbi:MAG: glycosyl hydrolase family 18 protein [bacterium]|nr:glycosyl hydrolase family 18 protein [bacterium]